MSETVNGFTDPPVDLADTYDRVYYEYQPDTDEVRYFGTVALTEESVVAGRVDPEELEENKAKKPKGRTRSAAAKKTTSSRKASAGAKKPPAVAPASAERNVDEEIESEHPELSDEIKAFISLLVEREVQKRIKPLEEENARLKARVNELQNKLEEAKKAEPAKEESQIVSEAEREAMRHSGSPFRTGDKLKIDGQAEPAEVVSIPWKDSAGDWRTTVLVNGQPQHLKVEDLKSWNVRTAPTVATNGSTAAARPWQSPAAPAPAETATATKVKDVRRPRGWFGRRMMTEEEWTTYQERYQGRNRAAAVGAAALALLGGAWAIWQTFETEDIEATVHRIEANQHRIPKKVIIQKNSESSHQPSSTTEQQPTSTTEQETTTNKGSEDNNGGTATSPQKSPDNDEPLSGNGAFYGNFLPGGHGMALGYPKGARFERFSDGTAMITLQDGTTMNLHWNRTGKLTPAAIRDIRSHGYEVGTTSGTFSDREGRTFTHQYSVIGDKE